MGKYKVVFIGGIYVKEKKKWIEENSIGLPQYAADSFQKNIICGLKNNYKEVPILFNTPFLGTFPKGFKQKYYKGVSPSRNNENVFDCSFINLPIISHLSKTNAIKKKMKKCLKNDEKYVFIGYAMTPFIVECLIWANKNYKQSISCLIIPDLPEYMRLGRKRTSFDIIKRISNEVLYNKVRRVDSFVFLTKYMNEKEMFKSKPYVVIEGIAKKTELNKVKNESMVLYTGTLDYKYGIRELVDSFIEIKNNKVKLTICGSGDQEEYIKNMSLKDKRIDFRGVITQEECIVLQQKALFLVNPRSSKELYTKYSFPSKTLEYMCSGRPVLTYKLPGIPQEYDNYLFYVEDYDSFTMALEVISRIPFDQLKDKGEKAYKFVQNKKNGLIQAEKIKIMLDRIMNQQEEK